MTEKRRPTPAEIALDFAEKASRAIEDEALDVAKGAVRSIVAMAAMHNLLEETEVVTTDRKGTKTQEKRQLLLIAPTEDGNNIYVDSLGRGFVGESGISTESGLPGVSLLSDVSKRWYGSNITTVIEARERRLRELREAHMHDPRPKP